MKKLEKRCTFFSGGTPTSTRKDFYNGTIPFIGSGNIYDEKVDKYISEKAFESSSSKIIEKGDILYAMYGANSGDVAISKLSGAINQAILCIRTKETKEFLFQVLSHKKNSIVRKFLQGGQGNLSAQIVKKIKIAFPSIEEQYRISSLFTLLDERISTQNEIINHLNTLLNSLSHEIFGKKTNFSDENENNYPEWKRISLGKIGKLLNGLTGKTKEDFGNGLPYIQYKQIFDNSKIDISRCGKVQISENEKQTKFQFGDIFFTTSSETPNEIGTASVLLDEVNEVYLNSFSFGFRVDESILLPEFSQYLFRSQVFRRKMVPLAQGSTRYNISKSAFVKLEINLPYVGEQRKVANFLNSISGKLETEKKLLEKLQDQKKYFLQNLFI